MDNDLSKIKAFLEKNKLLVTVIKVAIFIVSIYFLVTVFYQNFQQIKDFIYENEVKVFRFILISAILYVGMLASLAKGWKIILESIEQKQINPNVIWIYLQSLIYKYLPGNVFHYANRQIAANRIGIKHKTLLKSNIYEIIGLISSSLFFSIFLTPRLFPHISYFILTIVLLLVMLIIFYFKTNKHFSIIIKSMLYYLMYFLAIGSICYYVINYLTANEIPFIQCVSLYAIAWIAGFVIPGAPGGIGVRESVFILLSKGLINQPDAIIVISLLRLSTTLGEVFAYFYARIKYHHLNDTLNS